MKIDQAASQMPHRKSTLSMDRFLEWSLEHTVPPLYRFVLVTVCAILVGIFRTFFVTSLLPWLFFIPLIVFVALFSEGELDFTPVLPCRSSPPSQYRPAPNHFGYRDLNGPVVSSFLSSPLVWHGSPRNCGRPSLATANLSPSMPERTMN